MDENFCASDQFPPDNSLLPQICVSSVNGDAKSRDLYQFTVLSVEITNLPQAHRFTKNSPWLKSSYGKNYSWVAEYVQSPIGDAATWYNLAWNFVLERNISDRSDFVVTICSKQLIIGRYVLNHNEFSTIPETKSGFFEVSGEIVNGNGYAGKIKFLCTKGHAPRPSTVQKYPNISVISNHDSGAMQQNVCIRILSVAVIDMKGVHLLESNSPFLMIECGTWIGITDTIRGAGIAARWNSLNWQFTLKCDEGIVATIKSNSVLVGKVLISHEDLVPLMRDETTTEVVKYLMNGKEISGKIKLNMFITSCEADEIGDGITKRLVNKLPPLVAKPVSGEKLCVPFVVNIDSITVLDVVKVHFIRLNSLSVNITCGSYGYVTEEVINAGQFAQWINLRWIVVISESCFFRINVWSRGQTIGFASLSASQLLEMPTDYSGNTEVFAKLTNKKNEIVGRVKLLCKFDTGSSIVSDVERPSLAETIISPHEDLFFPVFAIVRRVSLFDIPMSNRFLTSNVRIRISCDRKSATTDFGTGLKWMDLNWAMLVRSDSVVEVTVLSASAIYGTVSITPETLLAVPRDRHGMTEVKTQLTLSGTCTGKVQITFELRNDRSDTHSLPQLQFANVNSVTKSILGEDGNTFNSLVFDPVRYSNENSLSIKISIFELDVMDIPSIHTFVQNSVSVSAACGKWKAHTEILDNSGSCGSWMHLPWSFCMKSGSILRFIIYSRNVAAGACNFSVQDLMSSLGDNAGHKRVSGAIVNESKMAGKLKLSYSMEVANNNAVTVFSATNNNNEEWENEIFETANDDHFSVEIESVSATEFNYAQSYFRHSVKLKIMCDNFYQETAIQIDQKITDVCLWSGLHWNFPVRKNSFIKIFIESGRSTAVGTGTLSFATIWATPKDMDGQRECVVEIYPSDNEKNLFGKVKLFLKLCTFGTDVQNVQAMNEQYSVSLPKSDSGPNVDNFSPLKVLVFSLSVIDLISVHRMTVNCPCVNLACGKFVGATEVRQNSGSQANWDSLSFAFIFEAASILRILVVSKSKSLGGCTVSRNALLSGKRTKQGYFTIFLELLLDDAVPAGKLKMQYFIDL